MRKIYFFCILVTYVVAFAPAASAREDDQALIDKFLYLSQHTSSTCSADFQNSMAAMPQMSRITGSCCAAMDMHQYGEQIEGLKKYKGVADIPADPYDIPAGTAAKLISYDDITLTPEEQKAYDYALEHSREKGPCCCQCWHWTAYSGLAKHLIHNLHYNGQQIAEVWDLSDGCGGGEHHHHG